MKDEMKIKNKIEEVLSTAMKNLQSLVDVDVVVGESISSGSLTIIPVIKVMVGYIAGGGEYNAEILELKKDFEYPFAGGSSGGVSLQPIGFLVIDGNNVKFIKIDAKSAIEKLIEAIPELARIIDKNFSGKYKK